MSEHFDKVADRVVAAFKQILEPEAVTAVGEEGFNQLSTLVEAYITDEVLEHLEKVADSVQEVAESIRKDAEHFRN